MTVTTETDVETAARLRSIGWGPARILSGLGHPGYGSVYARNVLLRMERYGLSAGEAIYGGVEVDRKIYEIHAAQQ